MPSNRCGHLLSKLGISHQALTVDWWLLAEVLNRRIRAKWPMSLRGGGGGRTHNCCDRIRENPRDRCKDSRELKLQRKTKVRSGCGQRGSSWPCLCETSFPGANGGVAETKDYLLQESFLSPRHRFDLFASCNKIV